MEDCPNFCPVVIKNISVGWLSIGAWYFHPSRPSGSWRMMIYRLYFRIGISMFVPLESSVCVHRNFPFHHHVLEFLSSMLVGLGFRRLYFRIGNFAYLYLEIFKRYRFMTWIPQLVLGIPSRERHSHTSWSQVFLLVNVPTPATHFSQLALAIDVSLMGRHIKNETDA